jgi:hypothetical protein
MAVLLPGLDRHARSDAVIVSICLILFLVNTIVVKPHLATSGLIPLIVRGYLNDVLAGLAFAAYTNILFGLVKPVYRMRRLRVIAPYILCCGLFWELAAPLFIKPSTADLLDVVAYVVGALAYWSILVLQMRAERRRHAARGQSRSMP